MNDWIFIKLIHMIDFNGILKVTQGQGLEVKGQGRICNYVKTLFGQSDNRFLIKLIHRIDIDTFQNGKRSRSNIKLL